MKKNKIIIIPKNKTENILFSFSEPTVKDGLNSCRVELAVENNILDFIDWKLKKIKTLK